MAFREVTVVQIKEVLRRWLRGEGERTIAKGVGVDRKTARRYIAVASSSESSALAVRNSSPKS